MTGGWAGSTRRQQLPSNWVTLRRYVLERDNHTCHICGAPGADGVDHITSAARGGDDNPSNLAAIHHHVWPHCHRTKSSSEGGTAAASRRATEHHPAERHPGLL